MFLDARELPPGSRLETDVCIVGAGAAGVTLARELARAGREALLLESGGFEEEASLQDLYAGEASGEILGERDVEFLRSTRLRYYGGSTNVWDGWCRPLDPIDFEERPWLPASGWPLTRRELDPFYARAAEVLRIRPFDGTDRELVTPARPELFPAGAPFETSFFHVSPVNFGVDYRDELAASARVRVLTHANLLRLRLAPEGHRVVEGEAGTLAGGRSAIAARRWVLAAGGIENPRLLLLSDDVQPRGIGNDRDLVGRYFMEHTFFTSGRVALPGWRRRTELYHVATEDDGARWQGLLRVRDETLRESRLLNNLFQIGRYKVRSRETLHAVVGRMAHSIHRQLPVGAGEGEHEHPHLGPILFACEQSPNPESRVTLDETRDALGSRRARLAWRLTELDRESVLGSFTLLARELGSHGLGRAGLVHDAAAPWRFAGWSYHHMGTTRMHDDPGRGVVDRHCRVHGVENLFVAGSSVFPTGGCSNPTFTLVALALRLADHLAAA